MWRPEAKRGQKWIALVPKVRGKEGVMEDWDLVEEFLSWIRELSEEGRGV